MLPTIVWRGRSVIMIDQRRLSRSNRRDEPAAPSMTIGNVTLPTVLGTVWSAQITSTASTAGAVPGGHPVPDGRATIATPMTMSATPKVMASWWSRAVSGVGEAAFKGRKKDTVPKPNVAIARAVRIQASIVRSSANRSGSGVGSLAKSLFSSRFGPALGVYSRT